MERAALISLLVLALALPATFAGAPSEGKTCRPGPDGVARCWSSGWILVQLTEPLVLRSDDSGFALRTGRVELDAAIGREAVHRIELALPVSLVAPMRSRALKRSGLDRLYRFHLSAGTDAEQAASRLSRVAGVAFAELDYVDSLQGQLFPDDPLFGQQWGFDQASDADVDGPEAWDLSTGDATVIAVVDTGMDSDHPDMLGQLVPGYDFANDDADPEDDNGHGTQVASVAAARTNNATGLAGACWDCRIMPLKTFDANGDGLVSDFADAVVWAVDHGAKVINYSAGGPDHTQTRLLAVQYAYEAGVLVVSAVGNSGGGVAVPARYRETVAVGASDELDRLWESSGSGRHMDVIAPGDDIFVASFTGGYTVSFGTSFSTPLVAGLTGLIRSVRPGVGREELRHLVRAGSEDQVGEPGEDTLGWDPLHGWGRVNMHRTLLGARSATSLRVGSAVATRVWLEIANPLATSYDFVRGDLGALAPAEEGVALGNPLCLENDSADPDTAGGNEDTETPAPGQGFYYLSRFNAGPWPGSWGGTTRGHDRVIVQSTEADWILDADQPLALFGSAVAGAGDVDDDGFDDIIVGALTYPATGGGGGAAFVYLGGPAGPSKTPSWTVESTQQNSGLGASVASAGDVNNDGFDDVIVGEPTYDGAVGNNEGRALVYLGSAAGVQTTVHRILSDPQVGARFGTSVAAAGDVNNDGFGDVIVGAPRYDNGEADEGRAYLFLGSGFGLASTPSWVFEPDHAAARAGTAVAGAGNVDGDLYDDVVVGAPRFDNGETDEGRVWVFLGSASGPSLIPHATLEIDVQDARFGASVATAGDIDDDGDDEIVVSALRYSGTQPVEGAAFVFAGSPEGLGASPVWSFETGVAHGLLTAVAGGVDVDNDGHDDVLVGSRGHAFTLRDEGRAWLFAGGPGGVSTAPAWSEIGRQVNAEFGGSVASAGDVNNDGFGDVVVGAGQVDALEYNDGRVYVFSGSESGLSATTIHACDQR